MNKPGIANSWMTLAALCTALIAGACSVQEPGPRKGRVPSIPTSPGDVMERLPGVPSPPAPAAMERGRVRAKRAWGTGMLQSLSAPSVPAGIHARMASPQLSAWRSPAPGEELWIIVARRSAVSAAQPEEPDHPGSGALMATGLSDGEDKTKVPLPLKHTEVHAAVTGYDGTVDVTQQFQNPFDEKIEAVYMFPLPERAAVSEFVMTIGQRRIRGILREKEEAEAIYREARAQGYQASLLTQHRPNVFEQKVANIEPGKRIDVNIRYFHSLAYRDGWYTFVLPTVVGPRYNPPGSREPVRALPRSHVQPVSTGAGVRYLRPGERSGHDIGITVKLDAGVAIESIESSHRIDEDRTGPGTGGNMQVTGVYPKRLPDLFVGRAVVVTGKFAGEPSEPEVSGRAGGQRVKYEVSRHGDKNAHSFIPNIWARLRIADLADRQVWTHDPHDELAGAIKKTALEYGRLMSDYTAFLAVDASRRTEGKHGTTVHQAVPVPRGVRYQTTVKEERTAKDVR